MSDADSTPEVSSRRSTLRGLTVACLGASIILLVAEWFAYLFDIRPGALLGFGVLFCIMANGLNLVLLLTRPRAPDPARQGPRPRFAKRRDWSPASGVAAPGVATAKAPVTATGQPGTD